MKIGFIGVGTMGAGMAANALAAGHEMVVSDLGRNAAAPLLDAGARWASTPREVAAASDVVFASLPRPQDVCDVVLGEEGLASGFAPGSVFIDLSTNSPGTVRDLHARLATDGVHMLDAPVSGGPEGARSGRLAIWVGGERAVYDRVLPVLEDISDQPMYIGDIGAGTIAKLVHNLTGYSIQTALAEAFTMGVKAGLPADALWQAVRQGAVGRRRTYDGMGQNFLSGRFDPPDFALALARKDVALAVEVGREFGVPMRLSQLTLEEMTEAVNRGWEGRDSRVAMTLQEDRAGVEVRVDPQRIAEVLAKD